MVEQDQFIRELIEYLDYIGWGDSWEREVNEDLRKRAWKWEEENPAPVTKDESNE